MSRIACIGSRSTPTGILRWMEEAGAQIVATGHTIVSGNTPRADQAWARGGNRIDPTRVELCLPWPGFELRATLRGNVVRTLGHEHEEYVDYCHSFVRALRGEVSGAAAKLLARNVMIVDNARYVMAYGVARGGTRFAVRVAEMLGKPVYNVAWEHIRTAFDGAAINGAIFP